MSARERARPWWREPLPPFSETELGALLGDGSITVRFSAVTHWEPCSMRLLLEVASRLRLPLQRLDDGRLFIDVWSCAGVHRCFAER